MYTTIIHPLRKALCLSLTEYIILDMIYHLSHNEKYGGWCIASKAQLSEWSDLSLATVKRHITTLYEKDLVTKNERGWLKTKDSYNEMIANKADYLIGFNGKESKFLSGKKKVAQNEPVGVNMSQEVAQNEPTGYQNEPSTGIKMSHNIYNNNYKDNNIYMSEEDFDSYWNIYPLKENKKKAKQVFLKIKKEFLPKILSAVEAQKKSQKWKDGYVPHPTTWLNGERWEDQLGIQLYELKKLT